jgi:acetyl esterase/lipase
MIWAIGHSIGLPIGFGLWRPEPLSIPDFILPMFELLATLLLVRTGWGRPSGARRASWLRVLAAVPAVLMLGVLTAAGVMAGLNNAWFPVASTGPVAAQPGTTTTLAYCSPDGSPLAMDLTLPSYGSGGSVPVAVNTRSAGWFYADRQIDGFGALLWPDGRDLKQALLQRGVAVASIDIRQVPLHSWPAPIEDAKCAVRFLRAHASELGIDPDGIGAYGTSAGGNLAALLGTAGVEAGFDVGEYLDQSSQVQAVVDMYGPTDLTRMHDSSRFGQIVAQLSFGDSLPMRQGASPLNYVTPDSAAFLILHGAEDQIITPRQSQELASRLEADGVSARLVVVQGTGHSMLTPGQLPSPSAVDKMCADFFVQTLS